MSAEERIAAAMAEHTRLFGNGDEGCTCGWGPGRWRDHLTAALMPTVDAIAAERVAEEIHRLAEAIDTDPEVARFVQRNAAGAAVDVAVTLATRRAAALRSTAEATR